MAGSSKERANDGPHGKGWAVPYTHECMGDVMGGVSCGVLRSTVAYKGELPAACHYDPDMIPSKETP